LFIIWGFVFHRECSGLEKNSRTYSKYSFLQERGKQVTYQQFNNLPEFLDIIGLIDEPNGIFNADELIFTVPYNMFAQMVERFGESFLPTKTWATVQKKDCPQQPSLGEENGTTRYPIKLEAFL
jgi:hypothetical protein